MLSIRSLCILPFALALAGCGGGGSGFPTSFAGDYDTSVDWNSLSTPPVGEASDSGAELEEVIVDSTGALRMFFENNGSPAYYIASTNQRSALTGVTGRILPNGNLQNVVISAQDGSTFTVTGQLGWIPGNSRPVIGGNVTVVYQPAGTTAPTTWTNGWMEFNAFSP